ncbi:hypothetical protein ACFXAF_12305 [Kitasatospora sp. NPDC059463]|uniref:hypothetical protein n=1 Tax=unclassified Kitasatospora TaxID=2633591 RepID=UPI0036A0D134
MPDVRVELRLGNTWNDITPDVRVDPIEITHGRADEGARVEPSRCTLTLDNASGAYAPRNPRGRYYGQIGRNTPLRVSVGAGDSYLDVPGTAGGRAATPDHPDLHITGDLDVRVLLEDVWVLPGDDIERVIVGRYDNTVNPIGRSWRFSHINGWPRLVWSEDGTAGTVRFATPDFVVPRPSGRLALRATLDVDDGAGGWTARCYVGGEDLTGPWTQVGPAITGTGTTSVAPASGTPLEIGHQSRYTAAGAEPMAGRVRAVEVRRGIDGPLVAAPDFTALSPGTPAFADGAGRAWTVTGGARVDNFRARFIGEVAAWSTVSDPSGADMRTVIEAAGPMRRLGQGASALDSTLRRSIPSGRPVAYWPMEDGRSSTQAASPIPGVGPLEAVDLAFASDSDLPGSRPLPVLGEHAVIRGTVPRPSAADLDFWEIRFLFNLDALPTSEQTFLVWTTSVGAQWVLTLSEGFRLYVVDAGGTVVYDQGLPATGATGGWTQMQIWVRQAAPGDIEGAIIWYRVGGSTSAGWVITADGEIGSVSEVSTWFGPLLKGMAIGHIGVFDRAVDVYNRADNGYEGNRASERFTRLCLEEGVPLSTDWSDLDAETAMGPQRPDTLLDLLGEAAKTDGGVLADGRAFLGLYYRPRHTVYNQPAKLALDCLVRGEVVAPLDPVEDDQAVRNDVTVTRIGGSSARAVAEAGPMSVLPHPEGIGRYDEAEDYSVHRDALLADMAAWRLHLGTYDGPRYPELTVNLAAGPHLIPAATSVTLRDRITVAHPPAPAPPDQLDLLVEGYTELLGPGPQWTITYHCSPGAPWQVAETDHPSLCLADTAGSTLASGATATATSLSISTTSGPLWSTAPADYPLDLIIAGERITVTAMTGTTSPQTATVTRHVNGIVKALPTGADVRVWQPAIIPL